MQDFNREASMPLPLYLLKRHPIAVEAHFEFVLVLTYAFPKELLSPLIPAGLTLDCHGDLAFMAAAFVQTRKMRPKGWPAAIGQDFFLAGRRIFTRFKTREGRTLRGLLILRSDADKSMIVNFGNALTHYNYHHAQATVLRTGPPDHVRIDLRSSDKKGDIILKADLSQKEEFLPEGSPFASVRDALKFAGPLPFTFDYEKETNSIVRIEGVRSNWHPRPVPVEVVHETFLQQNPFNQCKPLLCSAFWLEDIPYYWKRGVVESLNNCKHLPSDESGMQDNGED
ncbi:MAG: DUF2071 domain-containing protein [Candidatus Obscuribacterales bacterium]|nr:DUF2071 domain-containing protein [Candidatus Obscuribacterales bacterium]